MDLETEIFGGDTAERRAAVIHTVKSLSRDGLVELLLVMLDHIYDLENP